MTKVSIDMWQYVEPDPAEEPCFLYYRMAGLVDGKPWCATIGIEIDGQGAEYEQHWGESIECSQYPDRWDSFMMAMCDIQALSDDMAKRSEHIFGC